MINISIYLDKRRIKKDETYSVKIAILFYPLVLRGIKDVSLTEEEWNKLQKPNLRDKRLIVLNEQINSERKKVQKILDTLASANKLNRENFLKLYSPKSKKKNQLSESNKQSEQAPSKNNKGKESIYEIFERINKPFEVVPSGTFENYSKALKSFRGFKNKVKYSDLTPDFFKEYETHMLNLGNSLTVVGIYTRAFRRAIKVAIKEKYIKEENYPFGKRSEGKYPIPKGERKDRRTLDDYFLKKFIYFDSDIEEENYAKDIVTFSFYGNGMNVRDVFHLQVDNLTDKYISFIRRKTRRMTNEIVKIKVPYTDHIKRIISKWGTPNPRKKEYIFPLLNPLLNEDFGTDDPKMRNILFERAAYRLIKNEIRRLNRILLKIEKKTNAPIHLSTEIGRYTWANFLDRKGAPLKLIQVGLGHTRPETTLYYLEKMREEDESTYSGMLNAI